LIHAVEIAIYPVLALEWTELFTAKKIELIDSMPSRIKMLDRGVVAEIIAPVLQPVAETVKANNAAVAGSAIIETYFAAPIEPVAARAKGSTKKQIYVLKSHKDFGTILQSWLANDMPGLTLDELNKKLGFMVTAANKRLNDKNPIVLDGIETMDEIKTKNVG
jgi:hypothetical protein